MFRGKNKHHSPKFQIYTYKFIASCLFFANSPFNGLLLFLVLVKDGGGRLGSNVGWSENYQRVYDKPNYGNGRVLQSLNFVWLVAHSKKLTLRLIKINRKVNIFEYRSTCGHILV